VTSERDKAVLYTRSREDARELAALLDCNAYLSGDSTSDSAKATFLQH